MSFSPAVAGVRLGERAKPTALCMYLCRVCARVCVNVGPSAASLYSLAGREHNLLSRRMVSEKSRRELSRDLSVGVTRPLGREASNQALNVDLEECIYTTALDNKSPTDLDAAKRRTLSADCSQSLPLPSPGRPAISELGLIEQLSSCT